MHTHKVHREMVNYAGPLSEFGPPYAGFMVTHSESQSLQTLCSGGGVGSAVTSASVKTKTGWPPCECTRQDELAEIQNDSGVSMGGDSLSASIKAKQRRASTPCLLSSV